MRAGECQPHARVLMGRARRARRANEWCILVAASGKLKKPRFAKANQASVVMFIIR